MIKIKWIKPKRKRKRNKERSFQSKFFRIEKEIELEDLGEIFFRYTHKYTGYSNSDISRKYFFKNFESFFDETFVEFVHDFKIHGYRIL